ncbi:MAG: glycosyltransferase family 2 protein, partial [Bacteroidales bacterium]|nr:glycosyltransferase family 2 protein [Bacteroidales bacterium]
MRQAKVSIILHFPKEAPYGKDGFLRTVKSIFKQTSKNIEVVIIGEDSDLSAKIAEQNTSELAVHFINNQATLSESLNQASKVTDSQYLMYIDNREAEIVLKQATVDLCLLTAHQEKDLGLIY